MSEVDLSLSTGVAEEFSSLATGTISDALDRLSLPGSAHGISPLWPGLTMAGPAFTVRYVPVGATPGSVGDYLDDVPPGSVVVLDNDGRTYCTVWGDILTSMAHERKTAGTAINGVCRDVRRARELSYPIFSVGRFMRTGKDRVEVADIGVPVSLGDVRVAPGDIVVGDDDGVVVVPRRHADRILETAWTITRAEAAILADVLAGSSLAEARRRHGYHALQSPDHDRIGNTE